MDARSLKSELLKLFPVFAEMSAPEADRILSAASMRTVKAGTALFFAGNPCNGFPMLVSGTVRITKTNPKGREVQLYRVKPGESCIMSTGCLLGDVAYGATGTAETHVTLATLPPALFNELMAGNPPFRRYVFALFSERLSGMMELVEAVSFQHMDQRLAALLLERGEVIHSSQQKLADDLGTVREMVGRVLRNFEDRGWCSSRARRRSRSCCCRRWRYRRGRYTIDPAWRWSARFRRAYPRLVSTACHGTTPSRCSRPRC